MVSGDPFLDLISEAQARKLQSAAFA